MLRSAKGDAVFVVVYNKPGRLVPSSLRTPQGTKGLVRGACAEPLGHERERWWVIEMSNTGNMTTLYQPTVTVTTVTHTHSWLPTVADPHMYCKTLQNAAQICHGV